MHSIGNFLKNIGNFTRILVTSLVLKISKLFESLNKFVLENKLRELFCTKIWSSEPKYKMKLVLQRLYHI